MPPKKDPNKGEKGNVNTGTGAEESKIDLLIAKLDEVDKRMNKKIDDMDKRMDKKIDDMDKRMDKRIEAIEKQIGNIEKNTEGIRAIERDIAEIKEENRQQKSTITEHTNSLQFVTAEVE